MKNKSVIALAIASALAASGAAQAETVLYGSARAAIEWEDSDTLVGAEDFFDQDTLDDIGDGTWDLKSGGSRLGVRGAEDLGNGLSAIYQFEFGVNTTDATDGSNNFESARPKLVGLKHASAGTLSFGTQWTPYYNVAGISDVFNGSGSFRQYQGPFRKNNSMVYSSPDLYGFRFEGMLRADGGRLEDGLDEYNVGLRYQNGPVFIGGAYIDDDANNTDQWAAAAGFNWQGFAASVTYEDGDNQIAAGTPVDSKALIVTGGYTFGNNAIRAHYAFADPDDVGGVELEETDFWAVGFQHNFSKRTRVWVEYFGQNTDTKEANNITDALEDRDSDIVSIGMRHDF